MLGPVSLSRTLVLSALGVGSITLCGCLPMMVAGAASSAVNGLREKPASNDHLQPEARAACTERAEQHGKPHVIDVVQQTPSKIVVWGTAGEGAGKLSFRCSFTTTIIGFRLRTIKPAF